MASSETGTYWENLGYIGEIFTASPIQTPFLSAVGGLNGPGEVWGSFEFPCSDEYSLTSASQPDIDEDAELSAPSYTDRAITQYKNVVQTHYLGVEATYSLMGNRSRISGVPVAGKPMAVSDPLAHKIMQQLQQIAIDLEYSLIQGSYQIATDADVSNKTRGLNEAASNASNTVAAGGADLSLDLIKQLVRTMYGNGAMFIDPVLIVNGFQAQQLSSIFGYPPPSRTVGGVAMSQILLDIAGVCGVMIDKHQSTSVLTIADMAPCKIMFGENPPGKPPIGVFYEEHGRTSASITGQLYGRIGLDHGPYWMHGTITGLSTS